MLLRSDSFPNSRVASGDGEACKPRTFTDVSGNLDAGFTHDGQQCGNVMNVGESVAAGDEQRLDRLLRGLLRVEAQVFEADAL